MSEYYWQYATVAGLTLLGAAFVAAAFTVNRLLRPRMPTDEKLTTYECGIDPVGEGWSQTQVRYYLFAFLFVIFDVEALFLFPWAVTFTAFASPMFIFVAMVIFIATLVEGLLYAWRKGLLEWT